MEFDYGGKTAVEALVGVCCARQYPQPIFVDRSSSDGDKVKVIATVGGQSYGSGEGETSAFACEKASIATLSAWLKEDFKPNILRYLEEECTTDLATADDIGVSGSQQQQNVVVIFNSYIGAVIKDISSKPIFDMEQYDTKPPTFKCVLSMTINSQEYRCQGEGRTKVLAKRLACYFLLRYITWRYIIC